MPLTTNIIASIAADQTAVADFDTPEYRPSVGRNITLNPGQADTVFTDERSLAASGTENLDLNGALTDALGKLINFVRVKAIIVTAPAGNTADVIVGGAATNAFAGPLGGTTPTINVRPGGVMMFATSDPGGWPVVAATGDLLKITNASAGQPATYDIMIIGAST